MAGNKDTDYINQMYDSSLAAQKAQLEQDYEQGLSDLDRQQQQAQKQTDANLSRTYVEAEKARKNYAEVQNAYGLTSGAMAQARLAQDNQQQADMTAIRAAHQTADAEIERQRGLLGREYAAAIAQAQANNDLARAEALYAAAKEEEARLLAQQENAAALMAGVGDYSLYAQLYGLTPEQLAKLQPNRNSGRGGSGAAAGYYGGNGGDVAGQEAPQSAEQEQQPQAQSSGDPRGALVPEGYASQSIIDFLNRLYGLG